MNENEIVKGKILDYLSKEDEKKLQDYFVNEVREVYGRGITKDNCDDLFENWLCQLDLEELQNIIK